MTNLVQDPIPGVDLSDYQRVTDPAAIFNHGIKFAIIKSTEDTTYYSPDVLAVAEELTKAGIACFFYFMPHAPSDPNEVLSFMRLHTPTTGQVELDLEITDGDSWAQVEAKIQLYLDKAPDELMYSNLNFLSNMDYAHWPGKYQDRLWLAWPGGNPPLPYKSTLWQYGQGEVPGITGTVDLDYYLLGDALFTTWTGKAFKVSDPNQPPPPPPAPPPPTTTDVQLILPILRAWDTRSEYVRLLQHCLQWHGISVNGNPIKIDGVFGPMTRLALLQFQHSQGSKITHPDETNADTWHALIPNV